jgi:hypothetical protein
MTAIPEFADPRLVAIYDTVKPYGPGAQPTFYARLADDLDARVVIGLGCGTGLVTRARTTNVDDPVAGPIETWTDVQCTVEHVYGDWDRRPADATSRELVYISVSDSQPSGGAARRQHCSGTGAARRLRSDQSDSSASSWDV